MNKNIVFIFEVWCITISIIDKIIANSYIVLASVIIIMTFFHKPKICNNEKTLRQQILVPFIIAIVLFLSGIVLFCMGSTQYTHTRGLMLSTGGGLITYYIYYSIKYKEG